LLPGKSAEKTDALIGKPTDAARVHFGTRSAVEFDRLISLPTVIGPRIAGVATDAAGFMEVDDALKVGGSERVWAAGGCIPAALEHSALAARQADTAIEAIAAVSNDRTGPRSTRPLGAPELTGMLLTGQRDRWLAENPAGTHEPSTRCLWWPPGRAVGRMLAQQIAAWDPSVQEALPGHPDGLVIHAPVAFGCIGIHRSDADADAGADVSAQIRAARLRDIENRQLMAIQRRERAADAELRDLNARLQTLTANEQRVIHELQQHGYLLDHDKTPNHPRA